MKFNGINEYYCFRCGKQHGVAYNSLLGGIPLGICQDCADELRVSGDLFENTIDEEREIIAYDMHRHPWFFFQHHPKVEDDFILEQLGLKPWSSTTSAKTAGQTLKFMSESKNCYLCGGTEVIKHHISYAENISVDGKPLMSCRRGKARKLLVKGLAEKCWNKLGMFYLRLKFELKSELNRNQQVCLAVDLEASGMVLQCYLRKAS